MPTEQKFKLRKWGPKILRGILQAIEDRINEITPKGGLGGITTSREPDGMMIHYQAAINAGIAANDAGGGGGSGGTPVAMAGAEDGAPRIFHLVQSSPSTPFP